VGICSIAGRRSVSTTASSSLPLLDIRNQLFGPSNFIAHSLNHQSDQLEQQERKTALKMDYVQQRVAQAASNPDASSKSVSLLFSALMHQPN
jgi:hypothetical protein